MSDYTKYLAGRATSGGMSRREFMGRAMAAGLTLAAADALFTSTATAAETPKKGGHLKMGLEGGATTDSKDPAKNLSQVTFASSRCWGEMLVEVGPVYQPSAAWACRILGTVERRRHLDLQDPQGREVPRRQGTDGRRRRRDAEAPYRSPRRKSGALGVLKSHQGDQGGRRQPGGYAQRGQCRHAAAAQRLPPGHPAERRPGRSGCRLSAPAPTR